MIYLKYLVQTLIFAIITTNYAFAIPSVQLLCERNRTETNWVDYRITLKNISSENIHNPKIHYYTANRDVIIDIDYITDRYFVIPNVTNVHESADIEFDIQGSIAPQQLINVNFRIHRQNWTPIDFAKDWSYVKYASVVLPNYFMTVYDDSHKLLWGDDPLHGNYNTGDVVTWSDRGKNTAVTRYNGSNEALPAGRFWLFKDTPLSPKERDLLAQRGISKLSIGKSRGKIVAVFKSDSLVRKKMLDSLIAGFYNAIPVADTEPVTIDLTDEDLYTEKSVCNAGQCHKEVELRPEFNMEISCWNDVDVNNCVSTIRNCGGQDIGVARGFIVATVAKDSLQCLSRNRDIEALNVQRELKPLMPTGRVGINISDLQDSEEWRNALAKERADLNWLKDVEYTGEGIVVGVYDTRVDFNHPAFNEYDSSGISQARLIRKNEFFGVNYDSAYREMNIKYKKDSLFEKNDAQFHGTNVSGIIGGNGNNSQKFEFRGVAPKVHFYTNSTEISNQVGHVVNHSHITTESPYNENVYNNKDFSIDRAIFFNWKSECTEVKFSEKCVEGDTLVKTVVFAAANNGGIFPQYGIQRSYHSILAPSKNPITVGMISAVEKIRAHESSMGPTWDGRIKPDVMAPGFSSVNKVDNSNPFEVFIDYIKLFRKNESTPYVNIDFKSDNHNLDLNGTLEINSCQVENARLHCLINHKPSKENSPLPEWYATWILADSTSFQPTDSIEIRYKITPLKNSIEELYGVIRCGTDNQIFLPWRVSGNFETIRKSAADLHKSVSANSLRIDFDFSKGLIAPDICYKDSNGKENCGYKLLSDGGTSQAAPHVSGLAALMYQKFKKLTGDPLDKHSMRNSTVKALLIHTAIDMEDSEDAHIACNADLTAAHNDGKCHFTPYGKGPDFATGWGYVDGKAALDLISGYNTTKKEFSKFKEIEIGNGIEKRWIVNVDSNRSRLRTTLVWDDAPGNQESSMESSKFKESKLINDLDMYLISPSGKYYYPWRLDTLPTTFIDNITGNPSIKTQGFENIQEQDVGNAYNSCPSNVKLDYECFDHLNNVEVVDVEDPEIGLWEVVVLGQSITAFNNDSQNAQIASLVSDESLHAYTGCNVVHNYAPQTDYSCTYELGNDVAYYVTFHDSTFVGDGDDITLFDADGNAIGVYVGDELAGKTIKVNSKKLKVSLHSNNDNSQGWGFAVLKIQTIPAAVLKMPFEAITKKRRIP